MVPRNRGELPTAEPKFNELIRELLSSYQIDDDDSVMELRASIKGRFRLSDDQINHYLFKTLAASKLKPIRRRHDSVDLTKVVELSYLVDGWLPKGDVSLVYVEKGTGKTCLALALSRTRHLAAKLHPTGRAIDPPRWPPDFVHPK